MAVKDKVVVNNQITDDIIDVDLSVIKKKKIRINGDDTKILELNISDMGIVSRLNATYPKLMALQDKVSTFGDIDDNMDDQEAMSIAAMQLTEIDGEMRKLLDELFQSNVSEVCGSDGSMYDPIDGTFRYEHIITALIKLYETNIEEEFKRMKARIEKHTAKYAKPRKR